MEERNEVVAQHYRTNYDRLVSQSIGRVGPDNADDAVQEAYARALKYWGSHDDFDKWFHQIWLNACKDVGVLYAANRGSDEAVQSEAVGPAGPSAVELARIVELLDDEPELRQRIIELRLVKGYTDTEICEILPVTKTNVKKVVHRFRKKL